MHCSCAFCLQTETATLDMDDSDDNVIQNTNTHIDVSNTNKF